MPTNLSELKSHCEALGLEIMVPANQDSEFGIRFSTSSYVNPEGEPSLLMICRLEDNGEYLELFAPNALDSSGCKYKAALFSCMLYLALRTRHLQVEHNPEDGEARFAIDMLVADGAVTKAQLDGMISCLTVLLERYYPVFRHAMDTGKIDLNLAWKPQLAAAESNDAPSPDLQALIDQVGGIDKLEALVKASRAGGRQS
jgi:hypothetical protein